MEVTSDSLDTISNEVSQNKCETIIDNNMPEESKTDYLCTSEETDPEMNVLYNFQQDAQVESMELDKRKIPTEANNETLNEEPAFENIKEMIQLESSPNSKALEEKNIHAVFNENAVSDNSSSDEEILQNRFPVQDESARNSPKTSASLSISDKESIIESDTEIKKKPVIIYAIAYNRKKSPDCKTDDLNYEISKQTDENEHQEVAIDIANSLSVEADNSNVETESSYRQSSITNKDLNVEKIKDKNKISSQEVVKTETNKDTFDQDIYKINDISADTIIADFFNGSFDISTFKPEKNSTMIQDDKKEKKQKQLIKYKHSPNKDEKYSRNVHKKTNKKAHSLRNYNNEVEHKLSNNYFDDLTSHFKSISENHATNFKKTRTIKDKNKEETINTSSDTLNEHNLKPKTRSGNIYSKANNQHKRVKNRPKYNEKDTILNNFAMKEENRKKNNTKSNIASTRNRKNEKTFKDFSNKTSTLVKSRNLRNSSLIASKKIKEIRKLENADSCDGSLLDADNSFLDSNIKIVEDSFTSTFKDKVSLKDKAGSKLEDKFPSQPFVEIIDIASMEGFQTCFKQKGKMESNKITHNRKRKSSFEDTFDVSCITKECQFKMNEITSKEDLVSETVPLDFLIEENEDTYERHPKNRKIVPKRQSKNNKRIDTKPLEYEKSVDKTTACKNGTMNMNYGVTTRSKRKTWDMLEKELLGESSESFLSNNVTKTVLLKEQSIKKQNMKDMDLYSITNKSIVQTIGMPARRNKYEGKYNVQNTDFKHLQSPTNNVLSNEILPYKSKNILEKTIAAMERCTSEFIAPKENYTEKEGMHRRLGFGDVINEISVDQEAEFHSNMTIVTNENEKYYKNEIVAILKQSSSKKRERSCRSARKTMYNKGAYQYDFSDAEHLVKESIVTESYTVENDPEEIPKTKSQALISVSDKKQIDPWTRLINELNIGQCNDENKRQDIFGKTNSNSLVYHKNLKQRVHPNTDIEMQSVMDLNVKKMYKQDEIEKEESEQDVSKQPISEKASLQSNHMTTCNDLNIQNNSVTKASKSRRNKKAESGNVCMTKKLDKTARKNETKERQALQMRKVKTSPKIKLQFEGDGSVKLKRCNRSFSSYSEESDKQKQETIKYSDKRFSKDEQKSERQDYKRYLNNLFKKDNSSSKEKLKNGKKKTESDIKRSKTNTIKDKEEERKLINVLIAKGEEDLFSISSSDSETVNKGSGLLFDIFDE